MRWRIRLNAASKTIDRTARYRWSRSLQRRVRMRRWLLTTTTRVRHVISPNKRGPVKRVDDVIPDPRSGRVVVDVFACGVGHPGPDSPARSVYTVAAATVLTGNADR